MKISDPKKRIGYLKKAEEIMIKEMPLSPIFHWNKAYLIQPHLKNVYISPIGSIHLGKAYITEGITQKNRHEKARTP